MIAIPNMDKPKSCYECDYTSITNYEWFCDRLDKQFPIELQRGEIDVLPDCPIIEIDEQILKTAINLAKCNRKLAEVEANEDKYIESNAD